jgi:hypothetical protein
MYVYEVRPRHDRGGYDLISDALPFARLWYSEPAQPMQLTTRSLNRQKQQMANWRCVNGLLSFRHFSCLDLR